MQDLNQGRTYLSSRGEKQVNLMPVDHAQRALDKMVRELGDGVRETELGKALQARVDQAGVCTDLPTLQGHAKMMRASDGKFSGAYR